MYVLTRVFSFTTYDGTTINNEERNKFQIRKNAQIYSIFKELQEKLAFTKITAHAFEAVNFLNIFLKFCGF